MEYGKRLNPERSLRTPKGIKGTRQKVIVTHNPSEIDQNQELLVRFPNLGSDDVIIPGTANLSFNIELTSTVDTVGWRGYLLPPRKFCSHQQKAKTRPPAGFCRRVGRHLETCPHKEFREKQAGRLIDLTKRRLNLLKHARQLIKDIDEIDYVFSDVNCRLNVKFGDGRVRAFNSDTELAAIISSADAN